MSGVVTTSSGLIENKKHFLHQYLIAFFGKQNEQKNGKTFSHFISLFLQLSNKSWLFILCKNNGHKVMVNKISPY